MAVLSPKIALPRTGPRFVGLGKHPKNLTMQQLGASYMVVCRSMLELFQKSPHQIVPKRPAAPELKDHTEGLKISKLVSSPSKLFFLQRSALGHVQPPLQRQHALLSNPSSAKVQQQVAT